MKLSIVSTLYQSENYLQAFYKRCSSVAQQLFQQDYEIILVNDGSPDDSLSRAVKIAAADANVVVVDLSRNFGHHKAMMTGLSQAKGELVFLIDSDLEEQPEWLVSFMDQMQRERCDVVYGVQQQRKGGWFERWSGRWYYRIFYRLAGLDLPHDIVTARLMTQRYVKALVLCHQERETCILGLWHITGFSQLPQSVVKKSISQTTYSFAKKINILINSVTAFSSVPLISIFYIGLFISSGSFLYFIYLLVHWVAQSAPLSGWTSVIASVWLLGGMIISFIGVVGIYLAKLFSEIKQRPYTIIRDIYKAGYPQINASEPVEQ